MIILDDACLQVILFGTVTQKSRDNDHVQIRNFKSSFKYPLNLPSGYLIFNLLTNNLYNWNQYIEVITTKASLLRLTTL